MSPQQKIKITDKQLSDPMHGAFLIRVADILPYGLQLLKAVRNKDNKIINFDISFSNKMAKEFLPPPKRARMFPSRSVATEDDKFFFDKLVRAVELDTQITSFNEHHRKNEGITYYEKISKFEDGVLIIYENLEQHKEALERLQHQRQDHIETLTPSDYTADEPENKKELMKVIKSEKVSFERFVQSITHAIPDILFIMDLNSYELLFANRKAAEILGYSKKRIDQMKNIFLDIMHPEDLPHMLEHLAQMKTASDGEVREIVYRLLHANGSEHWFIDRNTVFSRDDEGVPTEKIGISHDITKEKAAESEILTLNQMLLAKNRELESVNSELQTFTNIAANDYKETLQNLYTNLEYLIANDAKNLSNSGKANIRKAQGAIQKMKLLTDDIVSFSKIPYLDDQKRTTDLNMVFDAVVTDMNKKIAESNASVTSDTLPDINGFPLLLSLLFHHIIDNAIKFSHKNEPPEIIVTYKKTKSSPMSPNMSCHKITFSDKGIGIEPEAAAQLFEIFFKVHDKQEYRGSGVGLAVCKKVMDLHSGVIEAQSNGNKGAAFSCYFPVEED